MAGRREFLGMSRQSWTNLINRLTKLEREIVSLKSQLRRKRTSKKQDKKPVLVVKLLSSYPGGDGYYDGMIQVLENGVWVDVRTCRVKDMNG